MGDAGDRMDMPLSNLAQGEVPARGDWVRDRQRQGCRCRAYRDVFTACLEPNLPWSGPVCEVPYITTRHSVIALPACVADKALSAVFRYTGDMLFDLHSHTTASDGALEPQDLICRAVDQGVTHLAITDHDTVDAFSRVTPRAGLELIPGVEFSTTWGKTGIHILGLNIDLEASSLLEAIAHQSGARHHRAEAIADKLRKYGIEDALAGARAHAGDGHIGRPHFARHLVAIGFVRNEQEAFRKYLGTGKSCDIRQYWAEPQRVVEWIRDAGGSALLAHPAKYGLTRSRLLALASDFRGWGGAGLEVVSGVQIPSVTRDLAGICTNLGLAASWGSDFHRPGQPWAELGRYSTPPPRVPPVWESW